jgi:hypothetical protein
MKKKFKEVGEEMKKEGESISNINGIEKLKLFKNLKTF